MGLTGDGLGSDDSDGFTLLRTPETLQVQDHEKTRKLSAHPGDAAGAGQVGICHAALLYGFVHHCLLCGMAMWRGIYHGYPPETLQATEGRDGRVRASRGYLAPRPATLRDPRTGLGHGFTGSEEQARPVNREPALRSSSLHRAPCSRTRTPTSRSQPALGKYGFQGAVARRTMKRYGHEKFGFHGAVARACKHSYARLEGRCARDAAGPRGAALICDESALRKVIPGPRLAVAGCPRDAAGPRSGGFQAKKRGARCGLFGEFAFDEVAAFGCPVPGGQIKDTDMRSNWHCAPEVAAFGCPVPGCPRTVRGARRPQAARPGLAGRQHVQHHVVVCLLSSQ